MKAQLLFDKDSIKSCSDNTYNNTSEILTHLGRPRGPVLSWTDRPKMTTRTLPALWKCRLPEADFIQPEPKVTQKRKALLLDECFSCRRMEVVVSVKICSDILVWLPCLLSDKLISVFVNQLVHAIICLPKLSLAVYWLDRLTIHIPKPTLPMPK